jgi:hypothetical protein
MWCSTSRTPKSIVGETVLPAVELPRPTNYGLGRSVTALSERAALFLLIWVLVGCAKTEHVQLDGTNVSYAAPSGFVPQEGLQTDRPYVEFNLPPDRDGVQTLFPALSLGDLTARLTPARTLDAYVTNIQTKVGNHWLIKPRTIEIGGTSAIEMAFHQPSIAHISGGGIMERSVTTHLIILSFEQRHYLCELTCEPKSYARYAPRLYEFCGSVRVSS